MALVGNINWKSKALTLKDGVLRTNGALVSMNVPDTWTAAKSSKRFQPGIPEQTLLSCKKNKDGSKTSIGVFWSAFPLDEFDGRVLRKEVFEKQIHMTKGSPEATKLQSENGAFSNTTQLNYLLISTGPHAVPTEEASCLSFKTAEFKGMKVAIIECESEKLNLKSIEYCVDVSGNGQVLYLLYYKASVADFAEDFTFAQAAFESTIWRTDFDPTVDLDAIDDSSI